MSNIQDFLQKFSGSSGATKLDPRKFFNVYMSLNGGKSSKLASGLARMGMSPGVKNDLSMYVQSITIPKIDIGGEEVESIVGSFKVHQMKLIPTQTDFTMSILNTEYAIHENVFYPWIREITSPKWIYGSIPYTKARIEVTDMSNSNFSYIFIGARPTNITAKEASNEATSQITRDVTFTFDYMALRRNQAAQAIPFGDTQLASGVDYTVDQNKTTTGTMTA